MNNSLVRNEKPVILVTGGSQGIGEAIVRVLAENNYRMVMNYLEDHESAFAIEKSLKRQGLEIIKFECDASDENRVNEMFLHVEQKWGPVTGLINNAGVSMRKLIIDNNCADWHKIIDNNLKTMFLCCRRALPNMLDKRWGRIINISSVWGINGASCEGLYAASKAGMIALSKSLAIEYGPFGITVNAIAPGIIATDMISQELNDDEIANIVEQIPRGRLGDPKDIANACLFFLQPQSDYITGQVLAVDGGWKV